MLAPFGCAALAPFLILVVSTGPASAVDVFLDYNTDDDPDTFVNVVEELETVPVDIVAHFDAADLGVTFVQFLVVWGYGGEDPGDPGCFDTYGSVDYVWGVAPDRPPFTNIQPVTCVCRLRCFCTSQMLVTAEVAGLTQPGNYVIARLDFSRWGYAIQGCGAFLWQGAQFQTSCIFPSCANPTDPRAVMTLGELPVAVDEPNRAGSWGQVKALYR